MFRWGALVAMTALAGCGPSTLGTPYPDSGEPPNPPTDAGQPQPLPDAGQDLAHDTGSVDVAKPDPQPDPIDRSTHYRARNRNVDILFLVDDSSSMRLSQDNLNRNFPLLMQALKNQPGGLPNVHIGVISSDMGAGDGSIASCDPTSGPPPGSTGAGGGSGADGGFDPFAGIGGKRGILQASPRGTCTATGLQPGATFISDGNGLKNYTGNLEDVFTCIAALGESGCGFEHQFAAITRALGADGFAAPAENAGFLRPDAFLVIVMITNEDDCSASPNVPLYDTSANTSIASQLGPPANFRCNEFGHICNGLPPNRNAPGNDVNATVAYSDCTSNDTDGYLLSVRDTVNRIRALKADDGQVMVAAITGPRAPYVVNWRTPSTADSSCGAASCPWPMIAHSCSANDGSFADPAVRIGEMVDRFGANGRMLSICDGEFGRALEDIGSDVQNYVSAPCITGRVAKKSGTTRDDCTVVDNTTGQAIPDCADTNQAGPCWRLAPSSTASCTGTTVAIEGSTTAAKDISVDCQLCAPGVSDPARGCP
jgi:hypothetical protein